MSPKNIKTKLRHFIVVFIFVIGLSGSLCIAAPSEPPSHVRAVSLVDGAVKLWWDHSPSFDQGDVKAYRIYGRRKSDPLRNKAYGDKFKLYAEVDTKYQYWQSQPLNQIHIWKNQGLSFQHPKQWFGDVELQPRLEYDFLVRSVGNNGQENRDRCVIHEDDIPDPAGKYSNFTTKYLWWRFPSGVGKVNINAAYHDRGSGAVWFGTGEGVVRYIMLDSRKIASRLLYAPVDGLIGYNVYTIAKDHEGRFWFGTDMGISVYNPANERWQSYTADMDGLTGNKVSYIAIHLNQVWVATDGGGVCVIENGRVTKIYDTNTGLVDNSVLALLEDTYGRIWVGTRSGINVIEDGQVTKIYSTTTGLPNNSVQALLEDAHGHTWVGTAGGLSVIKNGQVTKTYDTNTGLPDNSVQALLKDKYGRIWVGTYKGSVSVIENGQVTENYYTNTGLVDNSVQALLEDMHGRIWVGTYKGSVSVIENGQVTKTYYTNTGLVDNSVQALLEDTHGHIWAGTRSSMNVIDNGRVTEVYDITTGLADNFVRALLEDTHGRIWAGTRSGINVIDNGQITKTYNTTTGLVDNSVQALLEDAQGRIWIGTDNGGLSVIENGQVTITFDTTTGLPDNYVLVLLKDAQGRIWVGTYNGGLSVIENGRVTKTFDTSTGLPDYHAIALLEDTQGRIWVGTYKGGVSVIENGRVTEIFDTTTGLADNHVLVLLEDTQDRIWVGTYKGGVSVIENGRVTEIFDTTTGLRNKRIQALLEDAHGNIWIGAALGGLNVVKLQQSPTIIGKMMMFAAPLILLALVVGSIVGCRRIIRYRKQIELNEPVWEFFTQAEFQVERVAPLRLRLKTINPSYSDYHYLSVTTLQEEMVADRTLSDLFENLQKSMEDVYGQIAYFVYPDKLSEALVIPYLRGLKLEHNFTLIPLKMAVLRDAIFAGNCRNTLAHLERPYLGSSDLYDTRNAIYDPMWFFGRGNTIDEVIRDVNRGQHMGIFGMRKVGKSSLTKQLEHRLGNVPKVSFDLQGVANVTASSFIFSHILDGLRQYIHATYPDMQLPASRLRNEAGTSVSEELDATQVFSEELSTLRQILVEQNEERRIIIFIDEADTIVPNDKSSEAAYREFTTAFGTLRSIAEEGGFLVLVVIGLDPDINRINRLSKGNVSNNPVFQFYKEVHVPCLAEEECATMVKEIGLWRNLKYDNASLDEIYKMSGGHPFVARLLCSCIVRNLDGKNEVDLEDVQKGIDYFLTERTGTYRAYFDNEIWDGASEIEQDILERLAESSVLSQQELMSDQESRERLRDALERLVRLALVEEDENGYRITMKLFELWLKEEVL